MGFYYKVDVVSHDGVGEEGEVEERDKAAKEAEEVFFFGGEKVGEFVGQVGEDVVVGGGEFDVCSGDACHGGIIPERGLSLKYIRRSIMAMMEIRARPHLMEESRDIKKTMLELIVL